MERRVQLMFLATTVILFSIATVDTATASSSLRRRYRSDVSNAVRQRLTTVKSEDQLIQDLAEVLHHGRTGVIRFYASWCPICQADTPSFLELIEKFPSSNFFRVDIDEHPKLTAEYGIQAVPTYFILRKNMSHVTLHSARAVDKYLTRLRQSRKIRKF